MNYRRWLPTFLMTDCQSRPNSGDSAGDTGERIKYSNKYVLLEKMQIFKSKSRECCVSAAKARNQQQAQVGAHAALIGQQADEQADKKTAANIAAQCCYRKDSGIEPRREYRRQVTQDAACAAANPHNYQLFKHCFFVNDVSWAKIVN